MRYLLWFLIACCSLIHAADQAVISPIVSRWISESNQRFSTFNTALELIRERNLQTLVETGTARDGDKNFSGDGGSTILFAQYAMENGAQLHSVDINQKAVKKAARAIRKIFGSYKKRVHLVCDDSIAFLSTFPSTIDFLYLDSYDYDRNDPAPSQLHHLKEIETAYPKLAPHSVVMIDDCDLPGGGKGKLAIEFLLRQGWTIYQSGYQVILVR